MNKHQIHSLFVVLRERLHTHVHDVATVACGMIIGLLVMTSQNKNEARQIFLETRTYQRMPIVTSVASSSVAPSSTRSAAKKTVAALRRAASREPRTSAVYASALSSQASSSSFPHSFPSFERAVLPVTKTPNWGAMRTPAEWNRTYDQMTAADFVDVPRYDLTTLTTPMESLTNPLRVQNIPAITAKLFYSTRYYGTYNLDAEEYSGNHHGVDLKLAHGTPVGSVGGGRVSGVKETNVLGIHVIVEHRLKNGETYYSVYGHLDSATVEVGQDVRPGQTLGYVGMTGNTTAPHVHLQIDRGEPGERHVPYVGPADTGRMVNPIVFISRY